MVSPLLNRRACQWLLAILLGLLAGCAHTKPKPDPDPNPVPLVPPGPIAAPARDALAPQLALEVTVPPTVGVGKDITCSMKLANNGRASTMPVTLRGTLPAGVELVRAEPAPVREGNQLIWTLSGLSAGQSRTLQTVFRSKLSGPVTQSYQATSYDGLRDEKQAVTQVADPSIAVEINGPASIALGKPIQYTITLTNKGTGTASNIVLLHDCDAGLEHPTMGTSKPPTVQMRIAALGPGQSRSEVLTLTSREAGKFSNRVTATADGNLTAKAEHAVTVQAAQLAIDLKAPTRCLINQQVDWTITVTNPGNAVVENCTVQDILPPQLSFVSADQQGMVQNGQILWRLGNLAPGENKVLHVKGVCRQATPAAIHTAVASAEPGLRRDAKSSLVIDGVPAFKLKVVDSQDPVPVGGKVTYRIEVSNQGSQAGDGVELRLVLPPEMKALTASGLVQPTFEGQVVRFPALNGLQPGQQFSYSVEAEVRKLPAGTASKHQGIAVFRAELRAASLPGEPVVVEESTTICTPELAGPASEQQTDMAMLAE